MNHCIEPSFKKAFTEEIGFIVSSLNHDLFARKIK